MGDKGLWLKFSWKKHAKIDDLEELQTELFSSKIFFDLFFRHQHRCHQNPYGWILKTF